MFATTFEEAELPDACAGGIGIHILCQLTNGGRREFLRRLSDALAPRGEFLVDACRGPARVQESEPSLDLETTIGPHTYQRWSAQEALGDHQTRVTHTFTVLDGDAVLREDTTESIFTPSPPERVHAEIAAAGFSVRQAGERFLILSLA